MVRVTCKLIGVGSTLLLLSLTQAALAASDPLKTREPLLAMDHDGNFRQPDAIGSRRSDMIQPVGRPQDMREDRANDKMGSRELTPMLAQDVTGQPHDHGQMWIKTEKMMHDQMGGTTSTKAGELAEERIDFLQRELQVTEQQMAEWNALADALRSARHHLVDSRKLAVLDDKTPSAERLERYERHLTARLEAVKLARAGFMRLYRTLNDVQKQTADAILLPLIATF